MEAWRLLAGLSAMLVVYAALSVVFGYDATPVEIVLAVLLGAAGLYVGNRLSERLFSERE